MILCWTSQCPPTYPCIWTFICPSVHTSFPISNSYIMLLILIKFCIDHFTHDYKILTPSNRSLTDYKLRQVLLLLMYVVVVAAAVAVVAAVVVLTDFIKKICFRATPGNLTKPSARNKTRRVRHSK